VLPVGNKVKDLFIPGAAHHSDREENEAGGRQESNQYGATGCLKQENREIAKEEFFSENFQAQNRT